MQEQPKRRTRGPRTPNERAVDAARTTATLFEKLPPDHFADETLKPIATFLRLVTRGFPKGEYLSLRELREAEDTERRFMDVLDRWRWAIDEAPVETGLQVEVLLDTARRLLRETKEETARLAAGGHVERRAEGT
jgi:hypothetical protein